MNRPVVLHLVWPLIGLGALLAVACLASIWYINRLQADLGETLRTEAAEVQAAQELQIQLRQLRFHLILQAADPSDDRRRQFLDDERRFQAAAAAYRGHAVQAEDLAGIDAVEQGYQQYLAEVGAGVGPHPEFRTVRDLVRWSDAHPVHQLLTPCRQLTDRSQERMALTVAQSQTQSRWAGRALLAVGLFGPLAGLAAGYTITRSWSRRVARLSVRVQAVQAQLDQDVGAMTLTAPQSLGDLDRQLDLVVGRVKEVCERLQAQEREILRAEQLAAVGQLAAGVAHEVRNPLTGIKMLVEAALRPARPTPLTREDLELIRDEVSRLERTAQGLLDFAKPPRPNRRAQDVRPLIARAADLTRPRFDRRGVSLDVTLPDDPLVASVDPDQCASVLGNLLVNALDATPPGGRVGVGASGTGGGVRVTVTDTGPGIDPSVADRMFRPFATTKPTGTGLGLAVARRIVQEHGGSLTAANRPGGGACFTVTLPAAEEASDA